MRTSESHPLYINEIKLPKGGRIGLTFCPGKKGESFTGTDWNRDLEADLGRIIQWGATTVITLLEPHEFEMLGVQELGNAITAKGLDWIHMPIVDGDAPDAIFSASWRTAREGLGKALEGGASILVHCRGGLGRAGTVACLLLIDMGMNWSSAVDLVRSARPGAIETEEQERYLSQYQSLDWSDIHDR